MLSTTNDKKQNWLINVMRFIFAIGIVLIHTKGHYFAFYVFVEAFFIISGIFLCISAQHKDISPIKYVYLKWLKLLPALLIGAIIYIILKNVNASIHGTWNLSFFGWSILGFVFDIIPIVCSLQNNGALWYIFALLWLSPILFLIVKKLFNKAKRLHIYILIVSIAVYVFIFIYKTTVDYFPSTKGIQELYVLLRGLAAMCIGISMALLSQRINLSKISGKKMPIVWTIAFILSFAAILVLGCFKYRTRFDILLIFLVTLIIFIAYCKLSYFNKTYSFNSTHFSGMSLFIFTCHLSISKMLMQNLQFGETGNILFALSFSIAIPIGIYFAYYFIHKRYKKYRLNKKQTPKVTT